MGAEPTALVPAAASASAAAASAAGTRAAGGTETDQLPRSPRYLSLDHARGVACLLVVLFHSSSVAFLSAEQSGTLGTDPLGDLLLRITRIGWIGVPFFFVISGYAISATADVFRRRAGGAGSYFKRRFRRIYPPYWAMIVLQIAIVFAVDVVLRPGLLTGSIAPIERPWTFEPGQWLGNLTLTETWRATALPLRSPTDFIIGQAWTLCYEEQFYLVTGLTVLLAPARLFRVTSVVTIAAALIAILAPMAGIRTRGFFFDGYWLAFASGILVYWQVNYGSRATIARTWALLFAGVAFAAIVLNGRAELDRDVAAAMLFAMSLLALHRFDGRIAASPLVRPLAFAGTICYSLYLSHAVIVRPISQVLYDAGLRGSIATLAVVLPVCLVAAIAVGWGFHVVIERHFLNRPSVAAPSGFSGDSATPEGPAAPAVPARTAAPGPPG